ncbi:flagellar biosynthetic protein FliO [Paenibacillus sediminis]|uniref:Flagellar protein FliO/FliZ n=1 Tax=Paenibacillus sediminis TaxID=664909 RepID=A0ABS4H1L8_9BACL|nr:flagellar biosynthetic protein FliO [Paenibacillus sediminis]MBP1936413.1 flagellar protein FliO/FliZ [Paenibacillus sediminis]
MPKEQTPTGMVDTSGYIWNLVTVIVVLAIIIFAIVFLIRLLGQRGRSMTMNRSIRTLGAVGLGPNKSLQAIELGGNIYVVGVGEDISLIDKISDPGEVASLIAALEQEAAGQRISLSPLLDKLANRFRKQEQSQEMEIDDSISFHEVFESKLRRMPNRKQKMEELLIDDNSEDRLRDP